MALYHDERGDVSSMRCLLLFVTTPLLLAMTVWEGLAGKPIFSEAVWHTWTTVESMLIVGVFAPRVAQYFAQQVTTIIGAMRESVVRRRTNGVTEVTP